MAQRHRFRDPKKENVGTQTSRLRQLLLRDEWMGVWYDRYGNGHSLSRGARDTIDGDKWSINGEGGEVVRRSAKICLWCTGIPGNRRGGSNCNLLVTACRLIYSWNRLTMHADADLLSGGLPPGCVLLPHHGRERLLSWLIVKGRFPV